MQAAGVATAGLSCARAAFDGPSEHERCVSVAHRNEETLVVEQSRVVRLLEVLQAEWYLHRRPVLGATRSLALADGEAAELVGEIYDLLRELLDLRELEPVKATSLRAAA